MPDVQHDRHHTGCARASATARHTQMVSLTHSSVVRTQHAVSGSTSRVSVHLCRCFSNLLEEPSRQIGFWPPLVLPSLLRYARDVACGGSCFSLGTRCSSLTWSPISPSFSPSVAYNTGMVGIASIFPFFFSEAIVFALDHSCSDSLSLLIHERSVLRAMLDASHHVDFACREMSERVMIVCLLFLLERLRCNLEGYHAITVSDAESRSIQCAERYSSNSSTSVDSSSLFVHCAENGSLFKLRSGRVRL